MCDFSMNFHDFPWPLLFSMTIQAWNMVFLNSMTFQAQWSPWNYDFQDNQAYLFGGTLVCSASASCAGGGGGGTTAAGTTAIDCGVMAGAAGTVTRWGSITADSTRRVKRGGGWLADDWPSPADDRDGWPRSNVCGRPAPPPRNGPLLRRGLCIQTTVKGCHQQYLITHTLRRQGCHHTQEI